MLGFRCAVGSRNSKIAFLSAVVGSIYFSSFQHYWDVAAPLLPRERPPTTIAMALQRAVRARLYKLPLAAAVQSRRPDLIEFGDLSALAQPRVGARQTCRSDRAAKVERPRAGAGECEATVTAP